MNQAKASSRLFAPLRALNVRWALVLICVLVPNLVMHAVAFQAGVKRPVMVVDYVLVALVLELGAAVRLQPLAVALAFALMLVISAGEMLIYLGDVFLFDLRQIVQYLDFVDQWPLGLVIGLAALVLLYCAGVAALGARFAGRSVVERGWLSVAGLVGLLLCPLGLFFGERMLDRFGRPNLASSQLLGVMGAARIAFIPSSLSDFVDRTLIDTVADLVPPPDRILSIGFESIGYMQSDHEEVLGLVMRRFAPRLESRYSIETGVRRFKGSTLTAELRELCGLQLEGFATAELIEAQARDCLPQRLAALGWSTVAVHGFSGDFYRRDEIYPALGFAEVDFKREVGAAIAAGSQADAPPMGGYCASLSYFVGTCDGPALLHALQLAQGHDKAFVHFMTKDLHFPFPFFENPALDCSHPLLAEDLAFCDYVRYAEVLFNDLATALLVAPWQPDLIVLWGDHRPHTENRSLRERFAGDRVPVITLRRREGAP